MQQKIQPSEQTHRKIDADWSRYVASHDVEALFDLLHTSKKGLTEAQAEANRERWGENRLTPQNQKGLLRHLVAAFINPFTLILLALALVSLFTDVLMQAPGSRDYSTVIIIVLMVVISGVMRYVQETKSDNAVQALSRMIENTCRIERGGTGAKERSFTEVVVGDLIHLTAGDMIPADLRLLTANDLFISQSALTGESEPIEKKVETETTDILTDDPNLVFMGSTVISGAASGIVIATGDDTQMGEMSQLIREKPDKSSFEQGLDKVSKILIRFMLVAVPIVLFLNGFSKGNWFEAFLFALSVAVGITPEMLPMIVTTCLAKGAVTMSKQKVIVKNLNAIQNMGAMDLLCTDKTGTLTQDKIILEYPLDIEGKEDLRVLRHAYLNAYFQTGLKNLMDLAIIDRTHEEAEQEPDMATIKDRYVKVDEVPFDFERRRMSVVVKDRNGKTQMITKGAVEEMLNISSHVEFQGKVQPLTDEMKAIVVAHVEKLNNDGMRVIGVAQKTNPPPVDVFSVKDECDMVLIGYLAFLDPPKESTREAIQALNDHAVDIKIITGDNELVTRAVCWEIGMDVTGILMGHEIDALSDTELAERSKTTQIFAKMSPAQKARVVDNFKAQGHVVGYMGDGINDAAAMQAADVGISVDTAVDIARETADVIMLEKDLMVLEEGIVEGRRTYANMIKYIKMTASSNFGNIFTILLAAAFLPFLPMTAIQLLLLNLIYDISCIALPWDNVDDYFLAKPRPWNADNLSKFMLWLGPVSSVFDLIMFAILYFRIAPMIMGAPYTALDPTGQLAFIAIFHAGWFISSMWTQSLVIQVLRTQKVPFLQSNASWQVNLLSAFAVIVASIIPQTQLGHELGLASLNTTYFIYLFVLVIGYILVMELVKRLYIKRYNEWM